MDNFLSQSKHFKHFQQLKHFLDVSNPRDARHAGVEKEGLDGEASCSQYPARCYEPRNCQLAHLPTERLGRRRSGPHRRTTGSPLR